MKVMKNRMCHGLMLSFLLLASAGYAHTESETNAVAKSMLEFVLLSVNDNLDDVDDGVEHEAIVTWPSFLGLGESEGWTPSEKKAAFAWYLSMLGTNDCTSLSATDQELVRIALSKCEELNYAEAAPSYKALALNPKGIYRYRAIGLALKHSPVSGATTEFVETIITNVSGYSSGERIGCYWEYAKKLRQDPCTNGVCASALSMFYNHRKVSGTGAVTLDRLFSDKIAGYTNSSNRLDTALSMLMVTNMRPQFVEYFVGVTNQLLSSGQPLPWINVGGGDN